MDSKKSISGRQQISVTAFGSAKSHEKHILIVIEIKSKFRSQYIIAAQ